MVGGVIPLGNVISGNARDGIEVRDRASGFLSFNTFAGVDAFGGTAPNGRDGILITSTGDNVILTSIVSANRGNGIEIGGYATGVQVTQSGIGTNTAIDSPLPNGGDGILIAGHAHGNTIGGFQSSIVPRVTISSNRRYGIQVAGSAHDNVIVNTDIGTSARDTIALGSTLGGIDLGPGTSATTIGGASAPLQDKILNNGGPGLTIRSSSGDTILGDEISDNGGVLVVGGRNNRIGAASAGNTIAANVGGGLDIIGSVPGTLVQGNAIGVNTDGVALISARGLTVGGGSAGTGNAIAGNFAYGLLAVGVCDGTLVQGNAIVANAARNVDLTRSRGIRYIPAI